MLKSEFMRQIRLEELNEAVLPEVIQPSKNLVKSNHKMGSPKHKATDKHDKACTGVESHYRED
mgnify:CR=1 FL=1